MLFHSFPRPRELIEPNSTDTRGSDIHEMLDRGFRTLQNITRLGLVCTPETLRFDRLPVRLADRPRSPSQKMRFWTYQQSRLCFTLCEPSELFEKKIRGLEPGPAGPKFSAGREMSHADLFGPFAIGIDPINSRRLGVVPTNYYAPSDLFGERFSQASNIAPGLNIQLICALYKIYQIIAVLAYLESDLVIDGFELPSKSKLDLLRIDEFVPDKIAKSLIELPSDRREKIVRMFDTNRLPAFDLLSSIDMLLNLFQETDSSIDGTILAFFEQREWRLIHGARDGTVWYCLGDQPSFRNPHGSTRKDQIAYLQREIEMAAGRIRSSDYFKDCWVLESVDGKRIADYIKLLIVPRSVHKNVLKALADDDFHCEIAIAEEFGYRS